MHQVAKSRDGDGHGRSEEVVRERPIKPEPVPTTLPRPLKPACEICRSDAQRGELGEQKNAAGKVAGELIVAERAAAEPVEGHSLTWQATLEAQRKRQSSCAQHAESGKCTEIERADFARPGIDGPARCMLQSARLNKCIDRYIYIHIHIYIYPSP